MEVASILRTVTDEVTEGAKCGVLQAGRSFFLAK
jgi:hypothetical protein